MGAATHREEQRGPRNVVVCPGSSDSGRSVLQYALGAFWVLLVTLWLCAMNAQRLYDTFLAPCPGPVPEPAPRHTPWCVAFAKQLAREVEVSDAGSVRSGCWKRRKHFTVHWRLSPGVSRTLCSRRAWTWCSTATPSPRPGGAPTWAAGAGAALASLPSSRNTLANTPRPCWLWAVRTSAVPQQATFLWRARPVPDALLRAPGDQASHLMWRLQHGDTFLRHPPAVAVVMIGTNDLGAAACLGGQAAITRAANGTATRCAAFCFKSGARVPSASCFKRAHVRSVQAVLDRLRRCNPDTRLLVLGILPRGWTDAAHVYTWPSMYAPGIAAVNAALQAWAKQDARAMFLDCGADVLPSGTVRFC